MRVDCRPCVSTRRLPATLSGALGLNSAGLARSLEASANTKTPKVRFGGVLARSLPGPSPKQRAQMMARFFFAIAFMLSAAICCVSPVVAAPVQGVSEDTVALRTRLMAQPCVKFWPICRKPNWKTAT